MWWCLYVAFPSAFSAFALNAKCVQVFLCAIHSPNRKIQFNCSLVLHIHCPSSALRRTNWLLFFKFTSQIHFSANYSYFVVGTVLRLLGPATRTSHLVKPLCTPMNILCQSNLEFICAVMGFPNVTVWKILASCSFLGNRSSKQFITWHCTSLGPPNASVKSFGLTVVEKMKGQVDRDTHPFSGILQ